MLLVNNPRDIFSESLKMKSATGNFTVLVKGNLRCLTKIGRNRPRLHGSNTRLSFFLEIDIAESLHLKCDRNYL